MRQGDESDIAETGLQDAAKAIEAAAQKLLTLRPRKTSTKVIYFLL